LIPQNSKVSRYELGTPTQISIINPAVLTPDGVLVTSAASIQSLDVLNAPNAKTFNMFGKIISNS